MPSLPAAATKTPSAHQRSASWGMPDATDWPYASASTANTGTIRMRVMVILLAKVMPHESKTRAS